MSQPDRSNSHALRPIINASLAAAVDALDQLRADSQLVDAVASAGHLLVECLRGGGKVLACGNGGSCADAVHFCEELTGRFRKDRRPLPAIACADAGHITCTANDYGYDEVFARWVAALAKPGDVLIVLSTSGNSRNILRALDMASSVGIKRVALLGKNGGAARERCELAIAVPGETTDRIQELHMLILHTLVESIEHAIT